MESVLACAHGVCWSTYEVYLAIGTAHGVNRVQIHIQRPRCSYITPGWTVLVRLLRYDTHWRCWRMPSLFKGCVTITYGHSNSGVRWASRRRALTGRHAACMLGLEGSCFLSWLHGQQKCLFRGTFRIRGPLRPKRAPEKVLWAAQTPETARGWGHMSRRYQKALRNRPKRRMSLPWDTRSSVPNYCHM